MKLREFKHSYTDRDRVITLLLLEGAEPRDWDDSWKDEHEPDASDQPMQGASTSYAIIGRSA